MASYCDVCSVQLNCMKQFTQHTEGKAHKKKLAQLAGTNTVKKPKIEFVPEGQLQSVDANKVEDQGDGTGSHQFSIQPQSLTEEWTELKFCRLCNKVLNSAHQAQQHYSSVKHLKRIAAQSNNGESGARGTKRSIVKTEYEEDIRQNGPGDGLGFDIDPSEVEEKKSKMDDKSCYLCNKTFTSPHVAKAHYSSIKHLKRSLANHNPEIVPKTKSASPCAPPVPEPVADPDPSATPLPTDYQLNNESWEAPLSTDYQLNNESWKAPITDTPNTYQEFREQKAFLNNQPVSSGHFFCSFCKLALNSQTQIDAHRAGTRHKKNVSKAKGQQTAITSTSSS